MRMKSSQSLIDRGANGLDVGACVAILFLLVVEPTVFHADPVATGMLLVSP
jgi:hypothetical protein